MEAFPCTGPRSYTASSFLAEEPNLITKKKERGFRVINMLMGIILMTLAVQFIVNGLQTILPTLR